MRAVLLVLSVLWATSVVAQSSGVASPGAAEAAPPGASTVVKRRTFGVRANAEYRGLVVVDEDPHNDRTMLYWAQGEVRPRDGVTVLVRLGAEQRFWAEAGDAAWFLQDVLLGGQYAHDVSLPRSFPRDIHLVYQARLYLPTSRVSQYQELRAAPELRASAEMEVVPRLTIGALGFGQYQWHRYAERAGYEGGMNTQLVLYGSLFGEYELLRLGKLGTLRLDADLGRTWLKRYASRDKHESSWSDAVFWRHDYGWGTHLTYEPMPSLQLIAGLEQGGSVLRNGVVRMFVAHRDETELVVRLTGTY